MRSGAIVQGIGLALLSGQALAEVPTYGVRVIATFETTTVIEGASQSGHVVGWQSVLGQPTPFVARLGSGMVHLPLPPGYQSGIAYDANVHGVVVGMASSGNGGEPAIWAPDGSGGYSVTIPEQFDELPSPLGGTISVQGGQAVAINDSGRVIGWSQYQGFQGGPATEFFLEGAPVNLQALGFEATPTDLNNHDIAVGGGLLFDCALGVASPLGLPGPFGGVPVQFVMGQAINDSSEVVGFGALATAGNSRWVTFVYDGEGSWSALNPSQLATPNVGLVYDINDRGDVSALGGVLFREEGVLVGGFDGLLDAASSDWDTDLGYFDNDRRVYTSAFNALTGVHAIVALIPDSIGCSVADLAEPFGVLDFSDVTLFLSAFGSMESEADLSEPIGVWDFSDVVAFLNAFGVGCP